MKLIILNILLYSCQLGIIVCSIVMYLVCLWCNIWVDSYYKILFSFLFYNMHIVCLTKYLPLFKLTSWFVWNLGKFVCLFYFIFLHLLVWVGSDGLNFSNVHLRILSHQHWQFSTLKLCIIQAQFVTLQYLVVFLNRNMLLNICI